MAFHPFSRHINVNININRNNPIKTHTYHAYAKKEPSDMLFENEPDLLTRKQAQLLLSVGKNTILKLISDGYLPAIMIAGSYRIKKCDLIDFIEHSALKNLH